MSRRLISWLLVVLVAANPGALALAHAHSVTAPASATTTASRAPIVSDTRVRDFTTSHHAPCSSHRGGQSEHCGCGGCPTCTGTYPPPLVALERLSAPADQERPSGYAPEPTFGSFSGRIERPPKANA